jgi:hypothetical protein
MHRNRATGRVSWHTPTLGRQAGIGMPEKRAPKVRHRDFECLFDKRSVESAGLRSGITPAPSERKPSCWYYLRGRISMRTALSTLFSLLPRMIMRIPSFRSSTLAGLLLAVITVLSLYAT